MADEVNITVGTEIVRSWEPLGPLQLATSVVFEQAIPVAHTQD